jgi:hypothetical protein
MRVLRELKREHPDLEISKHYLLATDNNSFTLTDKELYYALNKYKTELDMNTLSTQDMEKVISDTEDLFKEVEPEDFDDEDSNYVTGFDPYK